MALPLAHRRFTVEQYHRIGEAGILGEDDRVELIDGEIVEMTPIGSRHAACVTRLTHLLTTRVGERALVSVQNPVCLSKRDEPQPDLLLLRWRADFYAGNLPGAEDTLLVIEVADSSLPYDRDVKIPLYARRGIREVWIADLGNDKLHVFRDPASGSYRRYEVLDRSQSVRPAALEIPLLAVAEILP